MYTRYQCQCKHFFCILLNYKVQEEVKNMIGEWWKKLLDILGAR